MKILSATDAVGFRMTNLLVYAVLEDQPLRFKELSSRTRIGSPKTIYRVLHSGIQHSLIKETLVPLQSGRGSAKGYALDARGKELLRFLRMLDVDVDGLVLELKRNA